MDIDQLNRRLTLVANIAVIAGIVFLAIELNQNTASVRANAHQTWSAAKTALFETGQSSAALSKTIVQGLDDPSSLTDDNYLQFAFWCSQHVLTTQTTYFLHKEGVIPDSVFSSEFATTANLLSNSNGGSQWWQAGARTQFSQEFVSAIEAEFGKPTNFQRYVFTEGRGFHPVE